MHPASQAQDDGGQSAGPSSFVSRVRTNLKTFTKATRPKQYTQAEQSTGKTEGPTTPSIAPSPEPLPATQPLSIPRPQLPHLNLSNYKRRSAASAETYLHGDGGYGSSPTTLVGSPDSWSWESDSEWSFVLLKTTQDEGRQLPAAPQTTTEHSGEGQDAEVRLNHQGSGSDHPDIASPDTPSPQPSRSSAPTPSSVLPLLSLPTAVAQRAWSSGLPEDVWFLVAERLRQRDLAQFAAVCRDTRHIADRFLYRHSTIRNANGMVSWVAALANHPKRRRLVRSLTIGWDAAASVEGDADEAYVQMTRTMNGSRRLKTMTLFADAPEGRFATKRSLPCSIRTLNASAAVFLNIHKPLPPLLHLSVNVHIKDLKRTLGAICWFGETLLQLRLFVKWETPFVKTEDNPARWCVPLKTPRLVYFELREERSEKDVPLRIAGGRWDKLPVESTWTTVLAERVPSLRYLVWQPLWGEHERDALPGGAFYDVVREYRDNLFALLKLDVLAFVSNDGQYSCHEAGKEEPRDGRPVARPEDLWRSMRKGGREVQLL